jgi:hypothetical protein
MKMQRPTFALVFASPLQRPFRTCELGGFAAVAARGAPGRGRLRARDVAPLESTVEEVHLDSAANGGVFGTKGSAIR